MRQFIIRRVLDSLITLGILSATIFVIVRLTGDPALLMAEAGARPEDLERVHQPWGLDRSWPRAGREPRAEHLHGRGGWRS